MTTEVITGLTTSSIEDIKGVTVDGLTQDPIYGNFTESTEKTTEDDGSLYMANWLVVVLIGSIVLVFVAGLFIKRHQMIKDRQKREEQYLAYFHSVLPQSRLYGKIESPEQTSTLKDSDKKLSTKDITGNNTIYNEDNNFTVEKGLREVWEEVNNISIPSEKDAGYHHLSQINDERLPKQCNIPNITPTTNDSDISISIECDVHREKVVHARENEEIDVIGLTDMKTHTVKNETKTALYSSQNSGDHLQESSYIIWI